MLTTAPCRLGCLSVGVWDVWLVIDGMFEDAEVNSLDGVLWALLAEQMFQYIGTY